MTISSMTGFARDDSSHGALVWAFEIKSVNGRGFEFRCRLPSGYDALESELRRRLSARVSRGSLTVSLQVQRAAEGAGIRVNHAALDVLVEAVSEYAGNPVLAPSSLDGLMALPGVVESVDELVSEDERQARELTMLDSFDRAVAALVEARRAEGQGLHTVLTGIVDEIERLTAAASESAGAQPELVRARYIARVRDYLDEVTGMAPERLAQEVALLASKADVREELDRLRGHVTAARELLSSAEPVGRKLDFLAQEFNREANTLCSKAQDMDLTRIGLALKNAVSQFREQIQNIE